MKKGFAKRQIVVATLVVALGAAVFMNWYFTQQGVGTSTQVNATQSGDEENLGDAQYVNALTTLEATTTQKATANESNYFVQARMDRKQARDKAIDTLNKVVNNANASNAATKEASQALSKLSNNIKKENDIENIIKAKNISDCLVIIDNGVAEVIVKINELTDTTVLQ